MDALNPLTAIYVMALLIVFAVCCVGIFHHGYDDTLLQRWGMVLVALGAVFEMNGVLRHGPRIEPLSILMTGVAIYSVATLIKSAPRWRQGRQG